MDVDVDPARAEPEVRLTAVALDDHGLAAAVVEPDLIVAVQDLELEARHPRVDARDRRPIAELPGAEVGLGTGSQQRRQDGGGEQRLLHARRLQTITTAASEARIAAAMAIQIQVLLPPSPSVDAVVVAGAGGGGGGLVCPLTAVSVTRGAGLSDDSAPIQCTTFPSWYVTRDGKTSTRPGVFGICAVKENLPSAPCGIFPPDHVTTRPCTDSLQPAVGRATTSVTPAGIWTVSFTAGTLSSPSADRVIFEELLAGTFSGLGST